MDAVVVDNVSKCYRIYDKPVDRLRELFQPSKSLHRQFWALKQVNCRVRQGSSFGVIGENGSGKSTLLQIIAGTLQPTSGQVRLQGRVAALLELGAGFNPEFSGRENVFLNGAIMGLSNEQIQRKLPEIERFAEIGAFLDQPVKTYSSGMYVRLAFAVSVNVEPEVLLVDESLSVGDVYFQQRCIRKIRQMKEEGKTVLFVSHDMTAVTNLCDEAMWIEHGEVMAYGRPEEVVGRYMAAVTQRRDPYSGELPSDTTTAQPPSVDDLTSGPPVVLSLPNLDRRWGNQKAEVIGVQILDERERPTDCVHHGEAIKLRVSVRFHQRVENPNLGFLLRNRLGEDICGENTSTLGIRLPAGPPSEVMTVDFRLQIPILHPGYYHFSVAVADGTHQEYVICDWVDNAISLLIQKRFEVYGYLRLDCNVELKHLGPITALQERT
ncbi:MAG: ABC transporter ATP-binding protein [Acidobacteriota bacterium]